jgi:hypothetical protein
VARVLPPIPTSAANNLTESCDAERPHLITHVETTPAPLPDAAVTGTVHAGLRADDLLPGIHLVDGGYTDGGLILAGRAEYGLDLIGPVLPDSGWQARAGNGFGASAFVVDWPAQRVTCPEGKTSTSWSTARDRHGNLVAKAKFARDDCGACRSRALCTRNPERRRTVTLKPEAEYRALQTARERQATAAFAAEYALRAGIEGTISQGVRAFRPAPVPLRRTDQGAPPAPPDGGGPQLRPRGGVAGGARAGQDAPIRAREVALAAGVRLGGIRQRYRSAGEPTLPWPRTTVPACGTVAGGQAGA